jgi:hypothetical protein
MALNSGSFTCIGCGKKLENEENVEQCMVCQGWICSDCNSFGLCPKHFNKLSPEDQAILRANDEELEMVQKHLLWCRILVRYPSITLFGILFALILTSLPPGGFYWNGTTSALITLIIICGCIDLVILYFYFQYRARMPAIEALTDEVVSNNPHLTKY